MAQGQKKLDFLYYSMLLIYRCLGVFCPHSSSPFPDDSNHERVRQSICCTAPHKGFSPDLIFPGCSSLLIHFPWAQSQATGRTQTLVWAPVPMQAGNEERVGKQTHSRANTNSVACEVWPSTLIQTKDLSRHLRQRLRSTQKSLFPSYFLFVTFIMTYE